LPTYNRRDVLKGGAALVGAASLPVFGQADARGGRVVKKGRVKQSACLWCYEQRQVSLEDLCRAGAEMGLSAIDLLKPDQWETARRHGLKCSVGMVGAGTIPEGLNSRANHERIIKALEENIPLAAKAGVPSVIVFFGNRRGMGDAEGIANSVACLNGAKGIAERHGVNIVIELLNSKVDHKDYIGDRTSYGAEIVRQVNSPRVKLLYDIYHMQIMEGDVIRTIRDNHQFIAHYHTGGNPGRNEIDETQELYYPAICRAIVETGFDGYLAHEFIPKRDPLRSLREAVALCDV
jgi:hydroxypyruvate isomerase